MRYARRGKVRLVRTVTEPEQWHPASGEPTDDPLTAQPGDLILTDGDTEWSIEPDEFARTYRLIGDRCYERTGEVDARPAIQGERIESAEGPKTARVGDWVVRNDAGYTWLVSSTHFEQAYEPVDA